MGERTISNPVSGERCTFLETSRETNAARTIAEFDVTPGGGVPTHRHSEHSERIEVLDGEIEVTMNGTQHRIGPGDVFVIEPRAVHSWRNPSTDRHLKARMTMTPGHPGFERFLRVWFGLGRDGELRPNGMPRRFSDLALLTEWDPSILAGPKRLLTPLIRLAARRARKRGRDRELLRRYDPESVAG